MNERQKAFCDNYISNGGNATQAALAAGYSEKTARLTGSRLITNDNIRQYIDERLKPTQENRIMTGDEILSMLSRTARREEMETIVVVVKTKRSYYDKAGKKVIVESETPMTVQIPAKLSDANKAAELLGKFRALWDGQGKESKSNGILESLQVLLVNKK